MIFYPDEAIQSMLIMFSVIRSNLLSNNFCYKKKESNFSKNMDSRGPDLPQNLNLLVRSFVVCLETANHKGLGLVVQN